jgi:16S rRNA (guanine966-N2)-methyltransferase
MANHHRARSRGTHPAQALSPGSRTLRIVGGYLRRRRLKYSGDPRVRPMKDRTREAVFNLIGPLLSPIHALDLFAGTGVLGLESISRGASGATLIECHGPTAAVIRENIQALGVGEQVELITTDVFRWVRQTPQLPEVPWLVFCCPPYDYYASRWDDLLQLINTLRGRAPLGSVFVVEADDAFDTQRLPEASSWRIRDYPPARIAWQCFAE